MVSLLWLLACQPAPLDSAAEAPSLPELSPRALLTRASLDLRGVRPSLSELDAVAADPEALDPMLAELLQDPRLGAQIRRMWGQIYRTERDFWPEEASAFGLSDAPAFVASVGQEPLRLLSTIAEQDLPYTEIVLADWTMANESLAAAFPLDYAGTGWQVAHYTDGRPAAGLLSTNGFWWAYPTSWSNAGRARANEVSRVLVCRDYLEQPVRFDQAVDLSDEARVQEALRSDPGCTSCHSSLDPLASYLSGFYFEYKAGPNELVRYHPEREGLWRWLSGAPPGYLGQPGETLADLGAQMAADPRLVECFTQQAFSLLLQREVALEDTEALTGHREAFITGDLRVRALLRSVLEDPLYRAEPGQGVAEGVQKRVSPQLLHSQVEGLTGFRYEVDGYDLMNTDARGVRVLAGGVDGLTATSVTAEVTPTMLLAVQRLAEAAADHVAGLAAAELTSQRLFERSLQEHDAETRARELTRLHRKVLSRVPTDAELDALMAHWDAVYALTGSAPEAWESCLSVLLQHPDFLLY